MQDVPRAGLNPHRVPSQCWRHHFENIVGGANAVNSLVIPGGRLEAHRDKSAWFATYMAGTTSVSGTICVTRSWYTGFVVLSLRGPHQSESTEGRQDRSSTPHRKPSNWWSHRLDFIADGANAGNFLVIRSPIPWNEGASLSKTGMFRAECGLFTFFGCVASLRWTQSALLRFR